MLICDQDFTCFQPSLLPAFFVADGIKTSSKQKQPETTNGK